MRVNRGRERDGKREGEREDWGVALCQLMTRRDKQKVRVGQAGRTGRVWRSERAFTPDAAL